MNHLVKAIVVSIAMMLLTTLFIIWSEDHDKKVIEASHKYEECVKSEYSTTPTEWFYSHGEYPVCE